MTDNHFIVNRNRLYELNESLGKGIFKTQYDTDVIYLACILCNINELSPSFFEVRELAAKHLQIGLENENLTSHIRAYVWKVFMKAFTIPQKKELRVPIATIIAELKSNDNGLKDNLLP